MKKRHKGHIARFVYGGMTIAAIVAVFAILQFTTPYDPSGVIQTQGIKIVNFVNGVDFFDSITGLDVVGAPAPAIFCTLTNNVHIVGTDGSSTSYNTATDYFQPVYNNIVNSNNNAQVDHLLVRVYAYCQKDLHKAYNLFPFITGGTITVNFYAKDVNGLTQKTWGYSQPVITGEPNGVSELVAEFNEPVSAINAVANTAGVNYVSLQRIETTGTITFKQNLADTFTATYNIKPLDTMFGLSVVSPTGSNTQTTQTISILQPSILNNYAMDRAKTTTLLIQLHINGYTTAEGVPIVSIYKVINGVTDGLSNPLQDFTMPSVPNAGANTVNEWHVNLDLSDKSKYPAGTYEVTLHGKTLASGQQRPWVHAVFSIVDSTPANGGAGDQNPNGCTTQQLQNYFIWNGQQCVPISSYIPTLGGLNGLNIGSLAQFSQFLPIVGIIIVIILIALIVGHFAKKHVTGSGYLPPRQDVMYY